MTVQEAEKILKIDKTVNKIAQVSESTNYFIFNIVPLNAKNDFSRSFAPATAVDKETGRTFAFNPMRFSRDELKSIKRIR